MTRWLRTAISGGAAALAVSLMASCGVSLDDEPRPITQTTQPPASPVQTTVAVADAQEVGVYLLRDDRLERQRYPVAETPTLRQVLEFVLAAPAADADPELRSAIPPGTALRGATAAQGVATIDLTAEINAITGQAQKEAFAQMVFTALDLEGVQQVRFLVDGQLIDAPTDEGNLAVVTADDYAPPLNPR